MAGENIAGAPTVGLGQTVTFGFKPAGSPQAGAGGTGQIRAGVRGGAGAGMSTVSAPTSRDTRTLELLSKVADGAIGKQIEKARVQAWVSGMQRAMAGEAVEDIAKDQPAWARVFGDSDAVEGARAYQQESNVQKVLLSIEEEMPELRKLPPEEASKVFAERSSAAMTGHSATDMAIMQSLQRNLPAVLKRQVTAHYAYKQEAAATEEANALDAAAQRLQAAGRQVSAGTLSKEDFEEQAAGFSMLAVPAAGRDPKHFAQQRTASILNMVENGQFHAVNAMEKIGLLEVLSPAQRTAVLKSRQANELQFRAVWATEQAPRLAQLRRLSERPLEGMAAEDVVTAVAQVNEDWRRDTGASVDFFDGNVVAAYGERAAQAIQAAHDKRMLEANQVREKYMKAADAAAAEKVERGMIAEAFANGEVKFLLSTTSVKEDTVNAVTTPLMMAAINDPAKARPHIWQQMANGAIGGYTNQAVKGRLAQMVDGAVIDGKAGPSFANVYETWRRMYEQNKEGTSIYYGDNHAKFLAFNLLHPGPITPDSVNVLPAFATSFGPGASSLRGKLSGNKEGQKALLAAARDELSYYRPEMLGGKRDLRPDQEDAMMRALTPYAEAYGKLYDQKEAFKLAISTALTNGQQFVGGYTWQSKDNYQATVQKYIGASKYAIPSGEEFGMHVGDLIDTYTKQAGISSNVSIVQSADGSLTLAGLRSDGTQAINRLDISKVAEYVMNEGKAERPSPDKKTWWRFGPTITYRAPDDMPHPSAGPEAWKAYRELQRK